MADETDDARESLRQMIDEANQEAALEEARRDLIRLFEADDWRVTNRAESQGRRILLERGYEEATQWGICAFVLARLKSGFPIRAFGMGEPQGCRGIGYKMKNADGQGLYIELKIEEDEVWVISFHY